MKARGALVTLPFIIVDTPCLSAAMIAAHLRAANRTGQVRLVITDHVHIMAGEDKDGRLGPRWTVSQTSGVLEQLAKSSDCAVLALAQLSRGVDGRDGRRPVLSDLRHSGGLEEDADAVLLLYRAEAYLPASPPEQKPEEGSTQFESRGRSDHIISPRCPMSN